MKNLKLITLMILLGIGFGANAQPPRLPTNDELFIAFTESYASKRAHAAEYMNNDPARTAAYLKYLEATPEQIRVVADFTAKSLQRQVEICVELQTKYPKAKGVNCVEGVLIAGGLGHADHQREVMGMVLDVEKAKVVLPKIAEALASEEGKDRLAGIKKGLTSKQLADNREVEALESQLGVHSSFLYLQERAQATVSGS